MVEYLDRGDGYLVYRADGDGSPNVLMLTGGLVSIDVAQDEPHFARFMRRIGAMGRVIQFDPRGVGLSDPPDGDYDVDAWVGDAIAVLDAAAADEVVVLGEGTGGAPAIELAARAPERVTSLVLINANARLVWADDYPFGFAEQMVREWIASMTAPEDEAAIGRDDIYGLLSPSLANDHAYREWTERALRLGTGRRGAQRMRAAMAMVDVRESLPHVQAPTLVLARRDNRFMRVEHSEYLADRIADARLVLLPGADHLPWAGDVDELLDEIEEFVTGHRGSGTDRVFTTVLFTDIVASTERVAALTDATWRTTLDAHDALVRAEITRYGGREVNTTGDGFVATFPLPSRAIDAARAIVAATRTAGIEVRVGLHSGECERRGDDIAGLAVHIAARVAAAGAAGDVVVSRTVRDVVAGSGVQFADRGEQQLKGLDEPWRLYAVEP